jgi:hypothetical protein
MNISTSSTTRSTSSISVSKRLLYPTAVSVVALGVGVYATVALGRFSASVAFLALAAGSLGWVVQVLFRAAQALVREPEGAEVARATGRRRKELDREKQALLKALKELEFDHEMGKISDGDYAEIGGNYRARAVRVMRQLDATTGDVDYRSLVERDLKHRRNATAAPKGSADGAAGGLEPSQGSKSDHPAKPRCEKCSTVNDTDAEFCKKCGNRLRAEVAS